MDNRINARPLGLLPNENGKNISEYDIADQFKFGLFLSTFCLASISAKNSAMALQTPRKLPFHDTTNRSAIKLKNNKVEKVQDIKQDQGPSCSKQKESSPEELKARSQRKESTDPSQDFDEFDYTPFVFPPDNNCFCCGDNRKSR